MGTRAVRSLGLDSAPTQLGLESFTYRVQQTTCLTPSLECGRRNSLSPIRGVLFHFIISFMYIYSYLLLV